VLQSIRCLLNRPLCFWPERELARSEFHRLINRALARHTQQPRRERHPAVRRRPQGMAVQRHGGRCQRQRRYLLGAGDGQGERTGTLQLAAPCAARPACRDDRGGSRGAAAVECEESACPGFNQRSTWLNRLGFVDPLR
jgi:hypothetical protein